MNLLMAMQLQDINHSGSEWDNVLVIEERFPFDREEHRRWLYTCCTRAAQKLVLIKS
jgi:DNA helicase IV